MNGVVLIVPVASWMLTMISSDVRRVDDKRKRGKKGCYSINMTVVGKVREMSPVAGMVRLGVVKRPSLALKADVGTSYRITPLPGCGTSVSATRKIWVNEQEQS